MKKFFTVLMAVIILYPLSADSAVVGDINGDGKINLAETIYSLQVSAGFSANVVGGDINGDGEINLVETIYSLQVSAGIAFAISHNDTTYNTIISPYTGKVWLDRNLGASQVCTAPDDSACYGDHYQWGRNYDGHENRNSVTDDTLATQLAPVQSAVTGKFITGAKPYFDWVADGVDMDGSKRRLHWSRLDGSSVCPMGFRVPTITELKDETLDNSKDDPFANSMDAFNNFLRLPSAGYRNYDGTTQYMGTNGYLWASDVGYLSSWELIFLTGEVKAGTNDRTPAISVRCVQDIDVTPPIFTSSNVASVDENQTAAITLIAADSNLVVYSIRGGDSASFNVDYSTGVVTFKTAPDYESKVSYTFTAVAADMANNETTQSVTITLNYVSELVTHKEIPYYTLMSPYTGRIWLDRNLGASQVCTTLDDSLCYGDNYQWGRNADGHEKNGSSTRDILATQIDPVQGVLLGKFSAHDADYADWVENTVDNEGEQRSLIWSELDGTSVCPVGFRVPTITEIKDETIDNNANDPFANNNEAFNNFLRLASAGYRNQSGTYYGQGDGGYLNSSTVGSIDSFGIDSVKFYFFQETSGTLESGCAVAFPVRCIKGE